MPNPSRLPALPVRLLLIAAVCGSAACHKRKEPRSYVAVKDVEELAGSRPSAPAAPAPAAVAEQRPPVSWTLPPGWTVSPAERISVAEFRADAGEGRIVSVALSPLGDFGSIPMQIHVINMMRDMAGQVHLTADQVDALPSIPVGDGTGKVIDLPVKQQDGTLIQVVNIMHHRPGVTWMIKMSGLPAAVETVRPVFVEFLKSLRFAAELEAPAAAGAAPVPGTPPPGWTSVAPGQMQAAKFTAGTAEVAVSIFPDDTGGIAANVLRWRRQIGLEPVDDAVAAAAAKPLESAPEGAQFVELENAGRSLIGAIVPRGGQFYFYKLTGDTAAVQAARPAFLVFAAAKS